MNIAETLNEGLKRAYRLTIPAAELAERVEREVARIAPQMRMPGFRPGKVPANLVRKMHGPALQQDALNAAIQEGVQRLIGEQALRPAVQPTVELGESYAPGGDAEVAVALEVLPDVAAPELAGLKLERLQVEPDEAAIAAELDKVAGQNRQWEPAPADHAAAPGDIVVVDFVGRVDGELFEGGSAKDVTVELGAGQLIPGFEDGLVGARQGDERTLEVRFPDDYGVAYLKGKPATFDVTVSEVRTRKDGAVDDEFAKALGLTGLEQLRELVKGQLEQELNGLVRTHMKRQLLDQLAAAHDFAVPPSMVEAEFGQIWRQLEHEASHEPDPAAARAEMERERDDYRRIAERRVRLGLLLSAIGQANGIQVTEPEMSRLIMQAAQQYPAKDRERFLDYVRQDATAQAQLRAPLYEDKVVDFLFGQAEVSERPATKAELEAAIEAEEGQSGHVHGPGCGHDHEHESGAGESETAIVEPVTAETVKPKRVRKKKEAGADEAAAAEGSDEGEAATRKRSRAKKAEA